jgi:hypothetical protein
MKMDKVANSGNDEFYTPAYAVRPILKHLDRGARIWCPFDTDDSLFVRMLRHEGHDVQATHISNGEDFFSQTTPPGIDYIISNPPYSLKTEVLEDLFARGVPFAMLLCVVGLFESQRRFEMFRDNDFEVLYMNRRVAYFRSYAEPKPALNPPFSSVYICHKVLPEKIMFEEVDKGQAHFSAA